MTTAKDVAATPAVLQQQQQQQRQQRFERSMMNMGISFGLVLLAAQSLKSGAHKRKAEEEREKAYYVVEKQRQILRNIQNEEHLRTVARKCVQAATESSFVVAGKSDMTATKQHQSKSWLESWFGPPEPTETVYTTSSSTVGDDDDMKALEEKILRIIQADLREKIGLNALTEEEKDKVTLKSLPVQPVNTSNTASQTKIVPNKGDAPVDAKQMEDQLSALLNEREVDRQTNGTPSKKRGFSM